LHKNPLNPIFDKRRRDKARQRRWRKRWERIQRRYHRMREEEDANDDDDDANNAVAMRVSIVNEVVADCNRDFPRSLEPPGHGEWATDE
jgi:hypothetical protein